MALASVRGCLETRRREIAAGILLAGFAIGLVVYVTAATPTESVLGDPLHESKEYVREMETYGGTANVLASELREWVVGLWHGKALGVTLFCLSVPLAAVVLVALTPLPSAAGSEAGDRDN
jgi:hypothetical protein